MELAFRKIPPVDALELQPGEIYLIPKHPDDRPGWKISTLVFEKGPDALLRGPGEPQRIVIDVDPKFDDMLAAAIVQCRLHPSVARRILPEGLAAFARYAGVLRQGSRPTSFPLESSPEGLFLAMRGNCEKPLSDLETARMFVADWSRLADVMFVAAEEQQDPFQKPLLNPTGEFGSVRSVPLKSIFRESAEAALANPVGSEFHRELATLNRDMEVYREDCSRGESWRIRLPGASNSTRALLLRKPKSLLCKYWTRSPCPPPMGGPYPFLALAMGPGQWVFSVDPATGISLKPLADALQSAESKAATNQGKSDPWFDGKSVNYTQIASPRGGSRLDEAMVLKIVKRWCRASSPRGALRVALAAIALLLMVGAIAAYVMTRPAAEDNDTSIVEIQDISLLSVGVSEYQNIRSLKTAVKDAEAIVAAFKKQEGKLAKKISTRLITNEKATRATIIDEGLGLWLAEQALTRRSLAIITFSGHGFINPGTNRYHFAPHDYDPQAPGSTGISLSELQNYLANLPCPVFLLFDTCHSGDVGSETDPNDLNQPKNSLKTLFSFAKKPPSGHGMVIMAACARTQKANESPRWGHGALTLAVLEAVEGKYLYQGDLIPTPLPTPNSQGIVTLRDLDRYVNDRVEMLSAEVLDKRFRRQAAGTFTVDIALERIPIAVYAK